MRGLTSVIEEIKIGGEEIGYVLTLVHYCRKIQLIIVEEYCLNFAVNDIYGIQDPGSNTDWTRAFEGC